MKNNILDKLIFGSWLFDSYQVKEHKDIVKLFSFAFDKGIKKFDTAESYGDGFSEMLLGRAFKKKRDDIEIFSKFSFHLTTKKEIENALQKTLKRLNTDYLDIYFQHWPSVKVSNSAIVEIMLELKEKQYFKKLGVSNWELSKFEACEYIDLIDVCQFCYNPLWRKPETDMLSYLKEKNIRTISYSPYCQGLLVKDNFKPSDYARKRLIFSETEITTKVNDFKNKLFKLTKEANIKTELYLLLWNLKNVENVIFSSTKLEQISSIIEAYFNLKTKEDDLKKIDSFIETEDAEIKSYVNKFPNLWNWKR